MQSRAIFKNLFKQLSLFLNISIKKNLWFDEIWSTSKINKSLAYFRDMNFFIIEPEA